MSFRKELDRALKPILELPVDLQDIVAKDIVATVESRIATMRSIALRTFVVGATHSHCEKLNPEQSK